jgi:hypothetical protein
MKKNLIIAAIVVVAIFALSMARDQVIKSVVTVAATQVTGAPVHIDGFSLSVLRQAVRISGFRIYNPKGFSRGILIDLPKINVAYDLGSILKGKLHLKNAEIDLKEMGIEKNKEGKLNVDSLKVAEQKEKSPEKPSQQMPMQIDMLKLGIGKVVLKDYSSGKEEPVIEVYDLNIHKSYKDITSAQQLTALILAEPMKAAGIKGAQIYGVAMVAGVAVLPVAIAATFVGKDSVVQDFAYSFDKVYETSLAVLKKMGRVIKEDKAGGVINADINSAKVVFKLKKISDKKTEATISARKYLLPKPEIAGGVVYEISQKLK